MDKSEKNFSTIDRMWDQVNKNMDTSQDHAPEAGGGRVAAPSPVALRLAQFFQEVAVDYFFEGADMEGGDLQDLGTKHGLFTKRGFDPENDVDHLDLGLEAGDDWYVIADDVKALLSDGGEAVHPQTGGEGVRERDKPSSDHIPDVGKMVPDHHLEAMARIIAEHCGDGEPGHFERQAAKDIAALKSLPLPEGWRAIETAPKDGTPVDLWARSAGLTGGGTQRITDCWFSIGKWWRYDENGDDQCRSEVHRATHWMPLPTPPEGT